MKHNNDQQIGNADEQFERNVNAVLEQSVSELDAATEGRLRQARLQALQRQQQRTRKFAPRLNWAIASGVAALVVFGLLLSPLSRQQQTVPGTMTDLALLAGEESLELYANDVEFYLWLAKTLEEEADLPASSAVGKPGSAARG